MRALQISNPKDLRKILQEIHVDPYGIEIMLPKAASFVIRMNSVSSIRANILKQEMLSLGGDVAVARDVITGRAAKTDCILIGNLSQFNRLNEKLAKQPFGLNSLAEGLSQLLKNIQSNNLTLNLGKFKLNLGLRPYIMGIVNLTPDSFSQDGLYKLGVRSGGRGVIEFVEKMIGDGADIIDVGGESSRPGAKTVSVKEELTRTIPVIKLLAKKIKAPISIDTCKPQVARQALDNGAVIVNDISGLRLKEMVKIVAKYKAGVVIMHMKGVPLTMQKDPTYISLIDEIIEYLEKAIERAEAGGIAKDKIIIDPGIGFGKTLGHNLEILKRLGDLKGLGKPILIGSSRKSFIGKVLNLGLRERIFGSVSSCVLAVRNGAHIVRVHDVKEVKQALKIMEAIEKS